MQRFGLDEYADKAAAELPLGIRQRLSLAVAVVHEPKLLILDEPTSGVDPVARDEFWALLVELSRQHGVTIFISTHFMNEAERCDRISLMHAGKVLASDTPAGLCKTRGEPTLEAAFIGYLEEATGIGALVEAGKRRIPSVFMSRVGTGIPCGKSRFPDGYARKLLRLAIERLRSPPLEGEGEGCLQPASPARLCLPRIAGIAP